MIARSSDTPDHLPTIGLLYGDVPIKESSNALLQNEVFDGVELSVQVVMITVFINVGHKVSTVTISPVRCVCLFLNLAMTYNGPG